jgi:AcrR family transcriptional regulator
MARTQQQRREETIARLLDASIETIVEVGYARASAKVIAARAQVSDGALFRYFPTMGDFMAATAREAGRRLIDLGVRKVAEIPAAKPSLEEALTILRDVTSDPTNTVIHELAVAARTDELLRATLRDVMVVYTAKIYELAKITLSSQIDAFGEDNFRVLLAVLLNSFDGAAIFSHVVTHAAIEEQRIPLLISMIGVGMRDDHAPLIPS